MEEIISSVPAVLARWLGVTDKTVRELAKADSTSGRDAR
jgi:hypothetical protein